MVIDDSNKIGRGLLVDAMLALTVRVSTPVYAQVVGAMLSGTVTDAAGIPNTRISIKNIATGFMRTVTADNPGNPNNYIKTQCFAVPTAPSAAFYAANCDPTVGTFPQCFNLRGNSGRNTLIGPGTSSLDFSVFKNNRIQRVSENFHAQFRAEFFNVLNRTNFAQPINSNNTDIFDSHRSADRSCGSPNLDDDNCTGDSVRSEADLVVCS
jgi:hypothetical protein